jgi:glycosyltransferase involved in cell wall biosynthesis
MKKFIKDKSVLFVNRVFPPDHGPTGRLTAELSDYLTKNGWEVSIISLTEHSRQSKHALADPALRHYPIKHKGECRSRFDILLGLIKILLKILTIKKHSVIVTLTDPPMLVSVGRLAAKFTSAKHIHWVQDLYPDLLPVLKYDISDNNLQSLKNISRKDMKSADQLVTIGRCMDKHLKHTGIDPSRMTIIENWAPKALFDSEAPEPASTDKFRVIYAGNMGRAHDIATILAAAEKLDTAHPEIEFVFVGSSNGHKFLMEQRAKHGLQNMRFLPPQPDAKLSALLKHGDVHLVTQKEAALGLLVPCKFYSIMAVNRPAIYIGPEKSEIGKVIRQAGCGDVIAPKDSQALIDAILKYRHDAKEWHDAQKATEAVNHVYNPEKSFEKWLKTLNALIG